MNASRFASSASSGARTLLGNGNRDGASSRRNSFASSFTRPDSDTSPAAGSSCARNVNITASNPYDARRNCCSSCTAFASFRSAFSRAVITFCFCDIFNDTERETKNQNGMCAFFSFSFFHHLIANGFTTDSLAKNSVRNRLARYVSAAAIFASPLSNARHSRHNSAARLFSSTNSGRTTISA